MEYNFKKVHTGNDLAVSTIVFLVAVGLFFVNKELGICTEICSIFMFIFYKGGYKRDGQGVLLTKYSEELCKDCMPSIKEFLNGKDVIPQVKKGFEGGSVRLDVYYNATAGIAYAQLFDFVNYIYVPVTEIIELNDPRADMLIAQL